jgi:hypothetical protein
MLELNIFKTTLNIPVLITIKSIAVHRLSHCNTDTMGFQPRLPTHG